MHFCKCWIVLPFKGPHPCRHVHHTETLRGDGLKQAVDAAVNDRQAEAASRSAKLRDAQTQAAAADARLQTVSARFTLPIRTHDVTICRRR